MAVFLYPAESAMDVRHCYAAVYGCRSFLYVGGEDIGFGRYGLNAQDLHECRGRPVSPNLII